MIIIVNLRDVIFYYLSYTHINSFHWGSPKNKILVWIISCLKLSVTPGNAWEVLNLKEFVLIDWLLRFNNYSVGTENIFVLLHNLCNNAIFVIMLCIKLVSFTIIFFKELIHAPREPSYEI